MALPIYERLLFPKSLLLLQSDKLSKEFKKLLAAGANSAPFCGISYFPPTKITVLFFPTVVKSPTNYVLSKLHVTAELVLLLMYIKTSWVSQTVRVWMAVPLHQVPVAVLIHAFPLFFWPPFTLYCCTARVGTDCCIMYALMFFLLLLWENKSAHKGVCSFWENFSVMQ